MTKQYTAEQLSKMTGLKIPTLQARLKNISARFDLGRSDKINRVTVHVYTLSDEELKVVCRASRKHALRFNRNGNEMLDFKVCKSLEDKKRHWMYSFGFAGMPKISAKPSYVNKGVMSG